MRLAFAAAAALGIMFGASTRAEASFIAYDNMVASGLQNYGGSLGLDFRVNTTITVTALGAFDNGNISSLSGHDGSSGVTVAIFNTATGVQVGPSVTFTPTNAGTQVNADAFLSVTPLTLVAGTYSIVAANDVNYNSYGGPNIYTTTNTGGGAISFTGTARYTNSQAGTLAYPTTVDSGPANRYNAGTFMFDVPEPASMVILGAGLLGAGLYRRRR